MTVTLAIGAAGIAIFVPAAAPGTPMLIAAATRDRGRDGDRSRGGAGRAADAARRHAAARPPWRGSALALAAAVVAARLVPGHGKLVGFAVMALVGIAYVAVLVVTREFGPEDRAKFAKVFKR